MYNMEVAGIKKRVFKRQNRTLINTPCSCLPFEILCDCWVYRKVWDLGNFTLYTIMVVVILGDGRNYGSISIVHTSNWLCLQYQILTPPN